MISLSTPRTKAGAAIVRPEVFCKDGVITYSVNVQRLFDEAQPSSTNKSDGVMLDLSGNFQAVITQGGRKYNTRFAVKAGQMGSTWLGIKPLDFEEIPATPTASAPANK